MISATVHFGTETFVDGVDPSSEFYRKLAGSEEPPTTSTPSVGAFLDLFRRLTDDGSELIAVHIMETKSALINAARMAAQELADRKIHIVDSHSTTMGLGLLAMAAARAARAGQSAADILARLEALTPGVHVFAAIREMTQLRRSGRVSLGKALVAGLLSIKPVLYLGRSVIEVVDKARGWSGAVDVIVERAVAATGDMPVHLVVVHTNAETEARELMNRIRHRFKVVESLIADAGSALATHAGAGALGIVTMRVT